MTRFVMPWLLQRLGEGDPETGSDDDADQRTEEGEDHRFRSDHDANLPTFHADRPEQADLVRALEDGEHQRVDDPDEGDEYGQGEERVDQAEELVDLGLLRRLELGAGLDL